MKTIVSLFGENSPIFDDLNRRAEAHAASRGFRYIWAPQNPFDEADVIARLKEADAGIIDVEPYGEPIFSKIEGGPGILVRFGVGYDKVDLSAASRHGIAVARTTGANTMGVAEMALTLILASRRELGRNRVAVNTGKWAKNVANETALGTVGILGFGAIGQTLAGFLSGLRCRVVAYDPFPNEARARELGVELADIDTLFSVSDAISVHTPYSKETHHLVNAEKLAKMKPTAVIVNTARGNIIDEDALYDALSSGQIRGAGLDVYSVEPYPGNSKLSTLDNIILTPHVSSMTYESLWRTYEMAIDIAADFCEGKESPHILNPDYKNK
ncbi:phosphoglycerate dehydrogenase [Oscillospiraceae bacterium OttesenSCG-928-G22]|nr:phosphoglycerate dehydrogenase [Oscillospiraceae bacterium OttesenSCG-928-G22]